MAADPGIFQAYLQPPRSVADYGAEMDRAESNKIALAMQRMQMAEGADKMRATAEDRNAIRRAAEVSAGDRNAFIRALRGPGATAGTLAQADALEKGGVELDKGRAAVDKDKAATAKTQAELKYEAADRHARNLFGISTLDDVVAYVDEGIRIGVFPAEGRQRGIELAQQEGIAAWKAKGLAGAVPLVDRFKEQAQMESAQLQADTTMRGQDIDRATRIETTGMTNGTSLATTGMTVAQAERNSKRVDDRVRDTNEIQRSAGKVQYDTERGGVVNLTTGTFTPARMPDGQAVGPKDKVPKISGEVQRQIGGVMSFDKDLSALEEALKDFNPRNPIDQANTTKRARIQSLSKQAQLSAKEAAALGALTGPDMALLEGILNDPTNIRGSVAGGPGIAVQIAEARAGNKRRVLTLEQQYGAGATQGMPPELKTPPNVRGGPMQKKPSVSNW